MSDETKPEAHAVAAPKRSLLPVMLGMNFIAIAGVLGFVLLRTSNSSAAKPEEHAAAASSKEEKKDEKKRGGRCGLHGSHRRRRANGQAA